MSIKKSTILFDLDGTLFNSIPVILESFRETFLKIAEEYPGDTEIKMNIGSSLYNILTDYVSPEKLETATEIYRKIYLTKQDSGTISLFPATKEILEYLKPNYTLGIVTTKMAKHTIELLEQKNIQTYFDVVIGAENVERHKPFPDPLFKALEILDKKAEEAIYVGDALIDLQATQNAKMDFIAITTGTTSAEAFQKAEQKLVLPNLLGLKIFF